jgi:tetratricopeptide (TPR) repeat protein
MTQQKTYPTDRPLTGEELFAIVKEAVNAGDLVRASNLAATALDNGYMHPQLLNLRAWGYERQGRMKEALADLKQAVTISPGDRNLRNFYGETLAKQGRWNEAIVEFEAVLGYTPDMREARLNLASAFECVGELARAEEQFRLVLDAQPANALALAALANLAARRADWDTARRLAERALAAEPKQWLALTTLANVAVGTGNFADAGTVIDSALADTALPDADRAMMLTLKGDLLHAQSRYAEAFEIYTKANALRRKLFQAQYAGPGQEPASSFVQWQNDYFDTAPASAWKVGGASSPGEGPKLAGHVFLIGFARSGTTLLESVLAAHESAVTLDEKDVLAAANRAYLSDEKGLERLSTAAEHELAPLRADYWDRVAQFCGDVTGKVFVDKRPLGAMRLALIAKLFPQAKILFALRDPRDVVLSCYRRQFLLNPSMYEFLDLGGAARFYSGVMRLAATAHEKFGLAWLETRHEALVGDFEGEMRRVLAFLGLEWRAELHDFAAKAGELGLWTPSSTQVMRGLNSEGVGQWRHYRDQLAPTLPTLRPWIETFGYTAQ